MRFKLSFKLIGPALLVLTAGAGATTAAASDPADPATAVRDAEIAFARAFADRDPVKFSGFLLPDSTFLSPKGTLSGKAEVMAQWSKYLEPKEPPFSWKPERVVANVAGTIGLSTGPVFDPQGKQIAVYSSVWVKQADGSWKILFDGPGCDVVEKPPAQ